MARFCPRRGGRGPGLPHAGRPARPCLPSASSRPWSRRRSTRRRRRAPTPIILFCTACSRNSATACCCWNPQELFHSVVQKLADGRKIGLMVPTAGPVEQAYHYWGESGVDIEVTHASPYGAFEDVQKAAAFFKGKDLAFVCTDCMGLFRGHEAGHRERDGPARHAAPHPGRAHPGRTLFVITEKGFLRRALARRFYFSRASGECRSTIHIGQLNKKG